MRSIGVISELFRELIARRPAASELLATTNVSRDGQLRQPRRLRMEEENMCDIRAMQPHTSRLGQRRVRPRERARSVEVLKQLSWGRYQQLYVVL